MSSDYKILCASISIVTVLAIVTTVVVLQENIQKEMNTTIQESSAIVVDTRIIELYGNTSYGLFGNDSRVHFKEQQHDGLTGSENISISINHIVPEQDNKTKIILIWTPRHEFKGNLSNYYDLEPGSASFTSCSESRCFVTWDRKSLKDADAVLFNLTEGHVEHIPSRPTSNSMQRWVAVIMEPPEIVRVNWTDFNGLFNWTMSYRKGSDIQVGYGFVGDRGQVEPESCPGPLVPFEKKKSVLWISGNCVTYNIREQYVQKLGKYIDIDFYGRCGHNQKHNSVILCQFMKQYKFLLSFQSFLCKDYITELFFKALEFGVVPVVFDSYNHLNDAPSDSFIDASSYSSPEELGNFLSHISKSEERYEDFFKWKQTQKVFLNPWPCRLCHKIHEPINEFPSLVNLKKWWVDDTPCRTWNNETLETETSVAR